MRQMIAPHLISCGFGPLPKDGDVFIQAEVLRVGQATRSTTLLRLASKFANPTGKYQEKGIHTITNCCSTVLMSWSSFPASSQLDMQVLWC